MYEKILTQTKILMIYFEIENVISYLVYESLEIQLYHIYGTYFTVGFANVETVTF